MREGFCVCVCFYGVTVPVYVASLSFPRRAEIRHSLVQITGGHRSIHSSKGGGRLFSPPSPTTCYSGEKHDTLSCFFPSGTKALSPVCGQMVMVLPFLFYYTYYTVLPPYSTTLPHRHYTTQHYRTLHYNTLHYTT